MPVQEHKPRFGPGAENRAPDTSRFSVPKGGQAIVIGKGGKLQTAQSAPDPRTSKPQGKAKSPLAKPVQRVNRARGRNGER